MGCTVTIGLGDEANCGNEFLGKRFGISFRKLTLYWCLFGSVWVQEPDDSVKLG